MKRDIERENKRNETKKEKKSNKKYNNSKQKKSTSTRYHFDSVLIQMKATNAVEMIQVLSPKGKK